MCWMTRFIGVVVIKSLSAVAGRLTCNPRRQAVCSVILPKSPTGANRPHTPPVEAERRVRAVPVRITPITPARPHRFPALPHSHHHAILTTPY